LIRGSVIVRQLEEIIMIKTMDIHEYFEVFNSNSRRLSEQIGLDYQVLRRRIRHPDSKISVILDEQLKPFRLRIEYFEVIERA
jgi:hypothetical protein